MTQALSEQVSILLCEDDAALGELLADYLRRLNFDVELCSNGEDGLVHFRQRHFDLCLLDINMPQKDGYELLQDIRDMGSEVPVIFLTERKATEDIVRAYKMGCDDYLTKPCPMDILLCKVHALMRRCYLNRKNTKVEFDLGNGVYFDSVRQQLGDIHLSARESDVLLILCRNMNETVDRNIILRTVWSQDSYFASRSLSVYINHLRNYLTKTGTRIISVHGKGYKLIEEAALLQSQAENKP